MRKIRYLLMVDKHIMKRKVKKLGVTAIEVSLIIFLNVIGYFIAKKYIINKGIKGLI